MTSLLPSVPENDYKIYSRAPNNGASNTHSPSFQATKNDTPGDQYTRAEEGNPNLMPGNSKHILRRRRSHLKRWIEDQQYHTHAGPDDGYDILDHTESHAPTIGTPCNPYLAYPHLGAASFHPKTLNEVGSLHNYVVVDDIPDDGEEVEEDHASVDSEGAEHMSPPPSPALDASPQTLSSSRRRAAPSSFRHLHLFRSPRNSAISISGESSTSHNSSRLSLFRSSRQSTGTFRSVGYKHTKASSLSTLNLPPAGILPDSDSTRGTTSDASTWRWRSRGSSTPAVPHAHLLSAEFPPPRPSTSSTYTYSSAITPPTTMYDNEGSELLMTPSKTPLLNSIRSRAKLSSRHALFGSGPGTASVPSLWSSGRTSISHTPEPSSSTSRSGLVHKESAIRIPFTKHAQMPSTATSNDDASSPLESEPQIPHIVYPNGKSSRSRLSLSSLSAPTREKRKKKLIVSGIEVHDVRRFEAMRAWCESFGEVTQIVRVPNGDLHVHFRKAEVADTVCRVRAKVNISGVGSVHLSWFTGEKR